MLRIYSYLSLLSWLLIAANSYAYPLDGDQHTGINRLEGYRLVQQGKIRGVQLQKGALLDSEKITLRLRDKPEMALPPVDEQFKKDALAWLDKKNRNKYTFTILDLTQPELPRYVEHNGNRQFSPGSIGKLVVAAALFKTLADVYPDDIVARERVLRDTIITADQFIRYDSHDVPLWNKQRQQIVYRPLQEGDQANLWSYLDWMLSASSNAAASMVMKQILLLKHFGERYPVSDTEANAFIKKTTKTKLAKLLAEVMESGVTGSGLNPQKLRQGKFFTPKGKRLIPGLRSYATTRELVRFLLHLEQGKVVDVFSSREIKRLMYITQQRIRYASHPALNDAAVYFKSGSLYGCSPEPGYECGKYKGNTINLLNSVSIVESPAGAEQQYFYMVVINSNVLKENSSVAHQTLALRFHRLIEKRNRTWLRSEDKIIHRNH